MVKIKIKKKKDEFIFYPEFSNKNFFKKLISKKEFFKHKIPPLDDTIENLCNPSEFTHFPQQEFLRNYLSQNTPYNGVLIFHSVGVGKTCAAILIAEHYKNIMKQFKKKILVILSKNIKDNFIKKIYDYDKQVNKKPGSIVQCTGDTYDLAEDDKYLTREQKIRKINKNIKKNYEFIGYDKLVNLVTNKTGWKGNKKNITENVIDTIKKIFSNRVIIIDEIHNVKSQDISGKRGLYLETILKYSQNNKLVLMTATPMYNSANEIIFILNLLLLNDKRKKIKKSDIFKTNSNELTKNGELLLKEYSKGYISYLKGNDPIRFPQKIYLKNTITPHPKYDIYGNKISLKNQLKYLKLYPCYMQNEQLKLYLSSNEKNMNNINNNTNTNNNNDIINNDSSSKRNLLYISNIVFPIKNKVTFGSYGYTSNLNKGSFKEIKQKSKTNQFEFESYALINKGTKNEYPFIDKKYLENYSSKFYNAFINITKSKGLVYVYSEYLKSGVIPFALMLEQNGYDRYTISGEQQLLKYSASKKGYGGKRKRLCYLCGEEPSHTNHKKHKFKVGKYIMLTGNKNLSKIEPNKVVEIFNNKNNKYGEDVKIIIGTRVTGEGIDFKRIRQVHIIEPWYNMSRMEQVIGRAVRTCSHQDLPQEERNVEIFHYASMYPKTLSKKIKETETIDERYYRISENKDILIKIIERILKKNAIDCVLNKNINLFFKSKNKKSISSTGEIITQTNSNLRDCDYMNCEYKCEWDGPIKIDYDTYDDSFSLSDIIKIKKFIKLLFKKNYVYEKKYIIDLILSKFKDIKLNLIYTLFKDFTKNKIKIYDKNNIEGYIIEVTKYFVFQPSNISYEQLPIYYRQLPIMNKTKNISINKIKINNKQKIKDEFILDKYILLLEKNIKKHKYFCNNFNIKNYKQIITEYYLDRNNETTNINLLKELLLLKKTNDLNKIMLKYYKNNIFNINNTIGFYFNDNFFCFNKNLNNWEPCTNNIIYKIKNKKISNEINNPNEIFGILIKNKSKFNFKIVVKSKIISSKLNNIGRVCSSFEINDLYKMFNKILSNVSISSKQNMCFNFELILRYYQHINYKNKNWFFKFI